MAKKKSVKPIEAEVVNEEIIEEVIEEESVTEEVTIEEVSEEATSVEVEEEVVEPEVEEDKLSDQFIYAQLKVINKMNNPAKQRRLAARVLRNRKK